MTAFTPTAAFPDQSSPAWESIQARSIVAAPICDLTEAAKSQERGIVLTVGQAKHRQDVLKAVKPVVLDYDVPRPTHTTSGMGDYYEKAAVLVHPTFLSESYCRVAVEAMHHGCPIVYTSLGNLPELIGNTAGIGLSHEATPEQWVEAVDQAKRQQVARKRRTTASPSDPAVSGERSQPSTRKSRDSRQVASPWDIVLRIPRQYPGIATAADHLVVVPLAASHRRPVAPAMGTLSSLVAARGGGSRSCRDCKAESACGGILTLHNPAPPTMRSPCFSGRWRPSAAVTSMRSCRPAKALRHY